MIATQYYLTLYFNITHSMSARLITRLLYLMLLMAFHPPLQATRIDNLYRDYMVVSNSSEEVRQFAIKQLLLRVLIKLTGDHQIGQNTNLNEAIKTADLYVAQYHYQQTTDDEEQLQLHTLFDQGLLHQLLNQHDLQVWGADRPDILVWFGLDDGHERKLLNTEQSIDYIDELKNVATKRGVSVLFPLMDLRDNNNIKISDIWGEFKEPILKASERYPVNATLTIRIDKQHPKNKIRWQLYHQDKQTTWQQESQDIQSMLQIGFDYIISQMAKSYLNKRTNEKQHIRIVVNDIDTIDHYARVLQYLKSLHSVTSVYVQEVTNNYVSFDLELAGGQVAFEQLLVLGKTIQKTNRTQPNNDLHYELIR